jgi:hypothetical protein
MPPIRAGGFSVARPRTPWLGDSGGDPFAETWKGVPHNEKQKKCPQIWAVRPSHRVSVPIARTLSLSPELQLSQRVPWPK